MKSHHLRSIAIVAFVVLAGAQPAGAQMVSSNSGASPRRQILDVPFVPQSEALCGGAAAAMLFRYWGETTVFAEDFAPLVEPRAEGITVDRLTRAILDRGWRATPLAATADTASSHLARGRPIVALIEDRPGRYHYVVLVAWTGDRVVMHDPAQGPFRIVDRDAFDRAWAVTNRTALLILPPVASGAPDAVDERRDDRTGDACRAATAEAVRLARSGDLPRAESLLLEVESMCPHTADAPRELAGIRFLQKRWADAESFAGTAVARDPEDAHAWQLLAAARYLDGDATGALGAWNRRHEPRVDLARIDGLDRTPFGVVAGLLDLPPHEVLTDGRLARARRRVGALPVLQTSRVGYTPAADGRATIDVAVVERPLLPRGWSAVAAHLLHAAISRELSVDVANAIGNGELWTAAWRWWDARPRVAIGIAAPRLWRATGLWRVDASWEQQSYSARRDAASSLVSERRRAAIAFGDWASGSTRWEASAGVDRWTREGNYVSAGVALDRRWFDDRVATRSAATLWREMGGEARAFGSGSSAIAWRSTSSPGRVWLASAGVTGIGVQAPVDLWQGGDVGHARSVLLRAHPILHRGVIALSDVSNVVSHGSVEFQQPFARLPVSLRWALFVDAARRGVAADATGPVALVDVGAGLRVTLPGTNHSLRIDLARGVRDGRTALTAAWQPPWPGW